MSIFRDDITLTYLNNMCRGNMAEHLGIVFTAIEPNALVATMPVDHRTHQPMGWLHGGASVALAETVGSVAGNCTLKTKDKACVGMEVNANHVRSMQSGLLTATATPVHLGAVSQVWEIRMTNESGKLISISRLTLAVISREQNF